MVVINQLNTLVEFNFFKQDGKWKLTVSQGDVTFKAITFPEDVSAYDITSMVPILAKGENLSINVNFTEVK